MDSRREFLKKAALLTGGTGLFNGLPASIQRALAIDPLAGTTYLDAEHIVVLMQENRSFDHCYGSLRGVRGFNDRRVITMPDGDPVWFQKNEKGQAYAPFRLNIKETKSTWTGSLPHSWTNQIDARNNGKYDKWLIAKPSGNKEFAQAPLAMGYYNREDIPFYYSLADAFTVCDQNFCSSLTGTTPNRLFLWTGTIRAEQHQNAHANVLNSDVDYDAEAHWTTFPERLEDNNISWKIYQNEISIASGLSPEEDAWLTNFTDNPIEWFSQFRIRFSDSHRRYLKKVLLEFPSQIIQLEKQIAGLNQNDKQLVPLTKQLTAKKNLLQKAKSVTGAYTDEEYAKLSEREKNLHTKAFTTNKEDPQFRTIEPYRYTDGGKERTMNLPKGDVLHQFRKDVVEGKLPTISWVVGPENFSDHPGAPWYGAWYVSEVMDILTQNPDVWKKTIFILCYDENDGYFDHIPPFVPPDPYTKGTGLVSKGIDTRVDYVTLEQDMKGKPAAESRESPIGLGYRVPLVIASPWSRGGQVCSQVFDHTSILQFMEKFLSHKTGKKIEEPNISAWRRAVCGDLSSVFKPFNNEKIALPAAVIKSKFYESIHKAQFLKAPAGYRISSRSEIDLIKADYRKRLSSKQESGTRDACALPYELYADGNSNAKDKSFHINLAAKNTFFGAGAAGAPFIIYASVPHVAAGNVNEHDKMRIWNYAVKAGDELHDSWQLSDFEQNIYHLKVHGPNGFYREFKGDPNDPNVKVTCTYLINEKNKRRSAELQIMVVNHDPGAISLIVADNIYNNINKVLNLGAAGSTKDKSEIIIPTNSSFGWYNVVLTVKNQPHFYKQFAGHIETGVISSSDPAMA